MIERIMSVYADGSEDMRKNQSIQTAHRLKLIEAWGIQEGDHVLEIGCGQGDTTVALAFSVGETGFVYGVDIASENYGAPETLGQARARIQNSEIGNRVQMDFDFDIARDELFDEGQFDCVVLSHCLWYFASFDELVNILSKVRKYAKRLCLAEWDPRITESGQLGHFKAATIQAICESFKQGSHANIRTMFYPAEIEKAVQESGWKITQTKCIQSPDLQDGAWEVWAAVNLYPEEIKLLADMPQRLKCLLMAQIGELRTEKALMPMSVFCLSAQ